mmetsp:Transcript_9163/g.30313  ORF Transcript_9163/g.30313 Transcript_9163/m.30313 type:complete len:266 (-) Transcript_9163:78-875(-)
MSSRLAEPKRRVSIQDRTTAASPQPARRGSVGSKKSPSIEALFEDPKRGSRESLSPRGGMAKQSSIDLDSMDQIIVQTRMPGAAGKKDGFKATLVKKDALVTLWKIFKENDKKGTGNLSEAEFTSWIASWHPSANERTISGLISQVKSSNRTGAQFTYRDMIKILYPGISKEECDKLESMGAQLETVTQFKVHDPEDIEEAENLFKMLDEDGSGTLSKQEVMEGLMGGSLEGVFKESEVQALFSKMQMTDGYLTMDQFRRWYLKD